MTERTKFYLFIGIQIIFLLVMIGTKQFTLYTGKKILLEVVPADPRSIFRGEYARLNYRISTINIPGMREFKRNQIVYVKLRKIGKYWKVADVSKEKTILDKDEVFIIGRKRWGNRVDYGIESYFVPEGKAIEIERIRRSSKVSVEICVDRFGNPVINEVFINDKSVKEFFKTAHRIKSGKGGSH